MSGSQVSFSLYASWSSWQRNGKPGNIGGNKAEHGEGNKDELSTHGVVLRQPIGKEFKQHDQHEKIKNVLIHV
jgi:hypothetical protein